MDIHSPCVARVFIAPDRIQKILPAVDLARIQHHQLQQVEFFGRQINFPTADKKAAAVQIELQISTTLPFFSFSVPPTRRIMAFIRALISRMLKGFVM